MMQLFFNLSLAFKAIRTNKLRTGLTVTIIALGIMALVGILTATEVIKMSVYTSLGSMGANSFQVTSDIVKKKKRGRGENINEGRNIKYEEAKAFKDRYAFPGSTVSLSTAGSSIATVHYESKKTNPNINIMAVDENYLKLSDTKLAAGRNFSANEQQFGSYVCILGYSVAQKLFGKKFATALNKMVSIGDIKYRVVGVAESKGGKYDDEL